MIRRIGVVCIIMTGIYLHADAYTSANILALYHFSEGSGTVIYDSSGNNYNGTLHGGVTWVTGKYGTGLHFDGSTGYCGIPNFFFSPIDSHYGNFAVVGWVQTTYSGSSRQDIISKGDPYNSGYTISNENGKEAAWVGNCGSSIGAVSTAKLIDDNAWHQVVLTRSNDTVYVYTDGVFQFLYYGGTGGLENDDTLILGRHGIKSTTYYSGNLDEVMILNTALSASDVATIYAVGNGLAATPSLFAPSNGASVPDTSATLSWNTAQNASTYTVQVATNSGFSTTVASLSGISGLSTPIGNLVSSTTYFWQVNSKNTIGTSSWSAVWSFTMLPAVPPATPVITSPANGAVNVPTNMTLSWNTLLAASNYQIQLTTDGTFQSILVQDSGIAIGSQPVPGLAGTTQYYWRVRALNNYGSSSWASAYFETNIASPVTPALGAPANGSINIPTSCTLSWGTVPAAGYYLVQVSTSSVFANYFVQDSSPTGGLRAVTGLAYNATYYWEVRASNSGGPSLWTATWSFTTVPPVPGAPALASPSNSAGNQPLFQTLSWNSATGAATYAIQVATVSTFATTAASQSGLTATTQGVGPLAAATQYFWEANATNATGTGPWSALWSFTTTTGIPALSSPSTGATNQPISPPLSWGTVVGAASYGFQVSTVSTFSSTIAAQGGLTATSQIAGQLAFNTQYFWEANATITSVPAPWSAIWSFTTISGIPALSAPSNGSLNEKNAVLIGWGSVTGAVSYGLQVSTASNFSSTVFGSSGITADTVTVAVPAGNALFYWRAETANPGGGTSAWSGAWSFITTLVAPALSQPANLSTGVSIAPALSWTTEGSVSTYRLQAATDSLFSSIVKDSTFAGSSCTLNNLSNISLYYWHVLATGFGETSPWSSTWNFTTIYYPPPVPTLSLPGIGSSNQPTTLTLSWNSGGNASLWNVQISTSASFSSIFIQDSLLTATLQPVTGLANYTVYYWRVNAGNSLGGRSSWTGAWSFTTTPAAPVPALPNNDALGQQTTLTLDWGSIPGATSYDLQVSTSLTFSPTVLNQTGITASSATVSGLTNGTAYYWQVNTIVPGGISAWSGAWSFWTIFAPPVPALPTNGAMGQSPASTLSWGLVTGATSYSLQMSTSSSFSTTCFSQAGLTSDSATPGGLAWYTVYYWHVNAANAGGASLWSGAWSFTTAAHLVVPISSGWFMYSLNIHPADSSTGGVFGKLKGFILAMDGGDNLYWPGASLDEIGTLHTGSGYWVLDTLSTDTLNLTGSAVNAGSTPVSLPASAWNLVSYLPQVNMPIATALAPINTQLVLAMDGSSNFYWPAASLNEIGTMAVGDGYYIVTSAAVSLTYPAAGSSPAKELSAIPGLAKLANPPAPRHFAKQALTGNFAAFMAPHVEIGDKPAADNCEVGAYDTKGNLAGSGTVVNGLVAFAICGKDPAGKVKNGCLPSEKLTFKLWNGKTEYPLTVTHGSEPVFASRTILKATLAVPAGALISAFNLSRAYPNPFKGSVNIAFDVPTIEGVSQHAIEISIYDMKGALVKQLAKGTYQAGHYELPWTCNEGRESAIGSSVYVVRMKAQNFEKRLKLIRVE